MSYEDAQKVASHPKLTSEFLKTILSYDPSTGNFTWLPRSDIKKGRNSLVGKKAGALKNEYVVIEINCRRYYAHRLAWLYMTGEWPENQIDHINLNRSDNSWANLREANFYQNGQNKFKRVSNKSGFKGVSWNNAAGKWAAQISFDGKKRHLGCRSTPEEAYQLYVDAAKRLHGEFARLK